MLMFWQNSGTQQSDNSTAFNKIKDKIKIAEQSDNVNQQTKVLNLAPGNLKKKYKLWAVAAAALLFAAGGLTYIYYFAPLLNGAVAIQKTTAPGQRIALSLSDGTKITLNSQSTITYPASFTGNTREVTLNGEAFFDVKKDANHPFVIHTGKMNIKVLGTAFNVKSNAKDSVIETTLLRGAIEVTLNDRPEDRILLKPNEKLIVKNTNYNQPVALKSPLHDTAKNSGNTQYILTSFTYTSATDSTLAETAWMNNSLAFSDQSFEDIATQMQHRYGVAVVFKNESFKKLRFTGYYEKSASQVLDALRLTEKFKYRVSNSTIYIY